MAECKYHIGDKVRVLDQLPEHDGIVGIGLPMRKLAGKTVTINRIDRYSKAIDGFIYTFEELRGWVWGSNMFEPINTFELNTEDDDICGATFGKYFNGFEIV